MFDKKVLAEAHVLAMEPPGPVIDTDLHGVDWEHRKYILEVRPEGESPFRVETKAKVPIFDKPREGDTVHIAYDPKNQHTEVLIEGDPRYDPKLIRAAKKQQGAAQRDALLHGTALPTAPNRVVHFEDDDSDDEPSWTVPEKCPECGARVDQPKASMAAHPTCEFCHQPLPCEPVH